MESQRITAPIQIYIESRIDQRAGITAKHTSQAKIKKAVRRERALAGTAFFFSCGDSRVEIASKRQSKRRVSGDKTADNL